MKPATTPISARRADTSTGYVFMTTPRSGQSIPYLSSTSPEVVWKCVIWS